MPRRRTGGETVAYRIRYAVLGHPSFLDGLVSEIRLAGLRRSD
jgi:hypothetical protein